MLEKNIVNIRSKGSSCLACDDPIKAGEKAIQISIQLPAPGMLSFLGSAGIDKEAHLACAEDLVLVIKKRLAEAGWK